MKTVTSILFGALLLMISCNDIDPVYPDEPVVDYLGFGLFISVDGLGNNTLIGNLSFDFTDGDGNLGLLPLVDTSDLSLPDTVKYNFFLQLYDLQNYEFVEIPDEDGGLLKYRIPYLDKQPLKGTMDLQISYPVILYDTIYYTFWIYDRDYNRSNVDTTDIIVLSGIDLDAY
ncbi:MAG: hypothetical protein DRJ13_05065 [Bacteroidetes bacterium]|nr:MAG: hypothetical protein DRJ13_05065 [Bacteroidota bacterium]